MRSAACSRNRLEACWQPTGHACSCPKSLSRRLVFTDRRAPCPAEGRQQHAEYAASWKRHAASSLAIPGAAVDAAYAAAIASVVLITPRAYAYGHRFEPGTGYTLGASPSLVVRAFDSVLE
eukprot:4554932-Pleurochrysis_carterae.AAC.1